MCNATRSEHVTLLFAALEAVNGAEAVCEDDVTRADLHRVVLTIQAAIQLAVIRETLRELNK